MTQQHPGPGELDGVGTAEVVVDGVGMDEQTRCVHYRTTRDVVALRLGCCAVYYACRQCHDERADHAAVVVPARDADQPRARCGVCGALMTVREYRALHTDTGAAEAPHCPRCRAEFNPGCALHDHLYFEPEAAEEREDRLTPGQSLRQLANLLNGSTALGLVAARLLGCPLSPGPTGLWQAAGYRARFPDGGAFTVGDVIFTRPTTRMTPRLWRHEAAHARQYAWCLGLPFLLFYGLSAAWSLWRTGDAASRNVFERAASLSDGGYRERPLARAWYGRRLSAAPHPDAPHPERSPRRPRRSPPAPR
ncbi:MAG: CHY zinc finger protein [Micrococcus sp.]|nr:CHY zinc finger protein [Micrococcus sp.]